MGITLGLAAALGWGVSDFLARYATHRVGSYRSLLYMQFIGLLGVTLWVVLSGELIRQLHATGWQPWAWAVVAALLGTFGALGLYRSFEIGVLSIVSPIAASSSALTVVLAILSGEALSFHRAVGIAATLIGVVISSYAPQPETVPTRNRGGLPAGVGWALAASAAFGVTIWILGIQVTPALGGVLPVWITRMVTPFILLLLARPLRQNISLPRGRVWWLIGGIGVLDTVAFLAAAIGLRSDQVAVVSVLISLFSAVTVLLAWLFIHERLHRSQWLGIGVILVGVALVSA